MELNGTQRNSTELNGTQRKSTQINANQRKSTQINANQRNSTEINGTLLLPQRKYNGNITNNIDYCLYYILYLISIYIQSIFNLYSIYIQSFNYHNK